MTRGVGDEAGVDGKQSRGTYALLINDGQSTNSANIKRFELTIKRRSG